MASKSNQSGSVSEDTKLVKDKNEKTGNFIFQNTKITKIGFIIIIVFIVILVIGVISSGIFLSEGK
jgi:hypothetical protein